MLALLAVVPVAAQNLPPGGQYGGDLRVAIPAAPDLDPAQFLANRLVQGVVHESLLRIGPDQVPVGSLANIWTPNAGASTITFDLRAANWADGTPIDAQDVVWSYQRHAANGLVSGVAAATVDADTVRFTFTSGGGDFLGNGATLPIAWKDGTFTTTPSGPYASPNLVAGALELTANAQNWAGRPYFDRLEFRFPNTLSLNLNGTTRPDDAGCALMFRELDLIGWPVTTSDLNAPRDCVDGFGGFADGENRTLLDQTRSIPHLGSVETPGLRFLYLGMNTQRAPLTDPPLRQALSRALDRDLIAGTFANAIEAGTDIADSPVSPANEAWFNASVPRYRVPRTVSGTTAVPTLEAVNQFLDAAGYLDRDSDGWRDDPGGLPFGFTVLTYDKPNDPRVAKYLDLITKFQAIGINITQEEHTPADLRAIVASGAYDLFVDIGDARGEPSFLFDMFHSTGSANVVNLASPELDAILEAARDAIDPAVRRQAVFDAEGWIAINAPIAPIVHFQSINALDRLEFQEWSAELGGVVNYWSLTGAHVTQRGPLSVTVEALDDGLRSRETTTITVRTRDQAGNPVPSASVWLEGAGFSVQSGITDASGQFRTTLTAPEVASDQDVVITAEASKAGYAGSTATTTITVHASPREFTISLAKGATVLDSGNETFVRIVVRDRDNASVLAGATVSFDVSPAGLGGGVDAATGTTDASGMYEATFSGDTKSIVRFLITATVSLPGYANATAVTSLEVLARPPGNAPRTPALDTVTMVAVVATLAALYGAWQRRKWVARKP
jgi:ABC-type transport system substrate-binding protein